MRRQPRPPIDDLREKLNRKRQQRQEEEPSSVDVAREAGPPPDPPSLLRDPLRGDASVTVSQHRQVDRSESWTRGNTRRTGQAGRRFPGRRPWGGRSKPSNIIIEFSTQTGERTCTIDETKELSGQIGDGGRGGYRRGRSFTGYYRSRGERRGRGEKRNTGETKDGRGRGEGRHRGYRDWPGRGSSSSRSRPDVNLNVAEECWDENERASAGSSSSRHERDEKRDTGETRDGRGRGEGKRRGYTDWQGRGSSSSHSRPYVNLNVTEECWDENESASVVPSSSRLQGHEGDRGRGGKGVAGETRDGRGRGEGRRRGYRDWQGRGSSSSRSRPDVNLNVAEECWDENESASTGESSSGHEGKSNVTEESCGEHISDGNLNVAEESWGEVEGASEESWVVDEDASGKLNVTEESCGENIPDSNLNVAEKSWVENVDASAVGSRKPDDESRPDGNSTFTEESWNNREDASAFIGAEEVSWAENANTQESSEGRLQYLKQAETDGKANEEELSEVDVERLKNIRLESKGEIEKPDKVRS